MIDETFSTWASVSQDQLLDNSDLLEEELVEDYEDCLALFDWFADYSVSYLGEDVGECTDAYDIYEVKMELLMSLLCYLLIPLSTQAGINYSCYQLVEPLNSVWSGMGLILVAFVPMLACAVKIEGVFRSVNHCK